MYYIITVRGAKKEAPWPDHYVFTVHGVTHTATLRCVATDVTYQQVCLFDTTTTGLPPGELLSLLVGTIGGKITGTQTVPENKKITQTHTTRKYINGKKSTAIVPLVSYGRISGFVQVQRYLAPYMTITLIVSTKTRKSFLHRLVQEALPDIGSIVL